MLNATLTTFVAFLLALSVSGAEAVEAGHIVSMEGIVEIGRAGNFSPVHTGAVVQTGDTVRTGDPGRARILFIDDSVLNEGDGSTLVIDETVFNPNEGAATTMMHLLGGKVRVLVSEYYSGNRASYRIETATAVSGVRGTEFILEYDGKTGKSTVLGLGGAVAVNSTRDRKNHGVLIHADEITEVAKGRFPTPPRQIHRDDERYRGLMDGLDLPGGGIPESLLLDDPGYGGKAVPAPDGHDSTVAAKAADDGIPPTELPPSDAAPTGGDALGQPMPVLDTATDIDIHF